MHSLMSIATQSRKVARLSDACDVIRQSGQCTAGTVLKGRIAPISGQYRVARSPVTLARGVLVSTMAYYQCAGRVVSATRAIAPSVLRARAAGVSSSGGRAAHSAGSCCAPAHAAATIAKRACSTVADASGAASLKHKPHPLPLDHDGAALTLIQYPICPFWCVCSTVRAREGMCTVRCSTRLRQRLPSSACASWRGVHGGSTASCALGL